MRFSRESVRLAEALDKTIQQREEVVEALRLTHEYVGWQMLPPVPGWSWYSALSKYAPDYCELVRLRAAHHETVRHDTSQRIPDRPFRPCECDEDGRCAVEDHYWRSGIAAAPSKATP